MDETCPLTLEQKETQQRHQTPSDTPRRRDNREGEVDAQGKGGHKEHNENPLGPTGTGPPVKAGRRGRGREGGGGRQREGETLGRENP